MNKASNLVKRVLAFFVFVFLCPAIAFSNIDLQSLKLSKNFFPNPPPNAEIVSIKREIGNPGFLTFEVKTPEGSYFLDGLADLKKTLFEISVLEKIDDNSTELGIAKGAIKTVGDTGRGLFNFAIHPVDSIKGIGRGVGKVGSKVADVFREKENAEKGDRYFSSTKRKIAKELGVDVYSRNLELQKKLDVIAKSQLAGRCIVSVATFVIPMGAVASSVFTVSNINAFADELINDSSRSDLFHANLDALLLLGLSKEKALKFLNHPYYTPREITYLRFYFERIKNVNGWEGLLNKVITSTRTQDAKKIIYETQLVASAVRSSDFSLSLSVVDAGVLLFAPKKIVFLTAYDFLDASPLANKILKMLKNIAKKYNGRNIEVWNGGAVDSDFAGDVIRHGFNIRRMCLFSLEKNTIND